MIPYASHIASFHARSRLSGTKDHLNACSSCIHYRIQLLPHTSITSTDRSNLITTMKVFVAAAVCLLSVVSAADVRVRGAMDTSAPQTSISIGSTDAVRQPTALINKNTIAIGNNVDVTRSNILFSQNDLHNLGRQIEQLVTSSAPDANAAVLSRNILRAASTSDRDVAMMDKASAVVTAKGDQTMLHQRIADFLSALSTKQEQIIQRNLPRSDVTMRGDKDILRQPTGVINKNVAVSDTNVAVSGSQISRTSADQVVLTGGAKVADAVLPASMINVGKQSSD